MEIIAQYLSSVKAELAQNDQTQGLLDKHSKNLQEIVQYGETARKILANIQERIGSKQLTDEAMRAMKRNKDWFDAHKDELRAQYPNSVYFAILGEKVLDHDKDDGSLLQRIEKNYGMIIFYLVDINRTESDGPDEFHSIYEDEAQYELFSILQKFNFHYNEENIK